MNNRFLEILEERLSDTSEIFINSGVDAEKYIKDTTANILRHSNTPFLVRATVAPPGFPDAEPGTPISGWCVAQHAGYWLVYQPEEDRFCCFWGVNIDHLGAHGIYGSPLYCWTA